MSRTRDPGDRGALGPALGAALTELRAQGNVRLEQERIPWDLALAALEEALGR